MSDESQDLVLEGGLTWAEAVELRGLLDDMFAMMLSVTVEADVPVPGLAEQLALLVRTGIGEPHCRIQLSEDGLSAAIGPTGLDAELPLAALAAAAGALGGTWEDPVVTGTAMGPVAGTARDAQELPGGGGAVKVHMWAGVAYAFVAYAREAAPVPGACSGEPAR
ncbi:MULTISPECIES: hypothetical protein [Streptomycetaceae]|uniref:hypothetical protein n=1 Tax=Streptomycetaceae TaxID=2062 RepID=UPI00093DAE25|nr:hypothetical protein [Streptomyces sp. CB02056]OKH97167.1 hypothetical protein AMK13_38665 [Streptomyces sp. CB02056]